MKDFILVTGGAGFIGSHLCDYLIKKSFNVIAIDNLSTGSYDNISHLIENKKFSFINHDITKKFIIKKSINTIFHLASPASPMDYLKMPLETMRVSSYGTENILKIAKKKKSKIVIASTSEVYGNPLEHPQKETYFGNVNPVGERSVYDEAKRFQEALVCSYRRLFGLDIKIARIFNTYGPRMKVDDGRVLPALISQTINNKNLTVFGDGNQTRSFCYVDDLIEGLFKLHLSSCTSPINLGNTEEISINKLANEIIILNNSNNKIIYKPLPNDDPLRRRPDISKAKKILNWSPKISRKEGLKKTFDYFKEILTKI
jgi:dTDP-glucose 4,6-dehydratase